MYNIFQQFQSCNEYTRKDDGEWKGLKDLAAECTKRFD